MNRRVIILLTACWFVLACESVFASEFPPLDDVLGARDVRTQLLKGQQIAAPPLIRGEAVSEMPPLGKAADVCSDIRARDVAWVWSGTIYQGATWYAFQDPEAACPPGPYTYEVLTADMYLYSSSSSTITGDIPFHAEVWSADMADPACPVPGVLLWTGPTLNVTFAAGGGGAFTSFPLATSPYHIACVDGPYFVAVVAEADAPAGVEPRMVSSDFLENPQLCTWYLDGGDIVAALLDPGPPATSVDWNMWSTGRTADQNDCHVEGICDWQIKHCVWTTYTYLQFSMPSVSGMRDKMILQHAFSSPCTLLQVDQYTGPDFVAVGDPGLRISVWTDVGGAPGVEVAAEEIPTASVALGGWNSFTFPADQPLILQGSHFIMVSVASTASDADTMRIGLDDHDNAICDNPCATSMIANPANGGVINSMCDYYGTGYELFMELYTCCAPPKTEECLPGLADDWPTHAHDYARTNASSMELCANPCDVSLNWKANTTKTYSAFNNVTTSGELVLGSDDQAVHCWDIHSGALLWTYFDPAGIATASAMRNNITITGGNVYGSGGSAQSFFSLVAGTGAVNWSRHFNSMGGGIGDWLCSAQRFSVSVVMTVEHPVDGPTEIVIVADQAGCLWAFKTSDGTNYTGWGTNPVDMGDVVYHSPAYDGMRNLYVATLGGEIHQVDAATGAINWTFTDPAGNAFYSGCSYDVDRDVVYAATRGDSPARFCIDSNGSEVWSSPQGSVLYSSPTIGRTRVYFGINDPGGLVIVNKDNGNAEYDFVVDGIGAVDCNLALTCDNYLFVGDRNSNWTLLNVGSFSVVWQRHFQDWVWGTALNTLPGPDGKLDTQDDENYAIMSIWSDVATGYARGGVFCWNLCGGASRPMMEQLVTEVQIAVPFLTGAGQSHSEADVYANWSYCADLTITEPIMAYNVDPPATMNYEAKVTRVSTKNAQAATEIADQAVGSDYLNFFDGEGNLTKAGLMAGVTADEYDFETVGRHVNRTRFENAKQRTSNLSAGSDFLRTTNVTSTANPLSGGGTAGLDWTWDGSGLLRGVDAEYIELIHDDPDFYPEFGAGIYYPGVDVTYIGGCLYEWLEFMYFNGYDMWHTEAVHNASELGDGTGYGLDWGDGANDAPIYDGGFYVCDLDGDLFQMHYGDRARRFLPNPTPFGGGTCGIDYADYQPMGHSVIIDWYDGGNVPPVLGVDYIDVDGDVSWTNFIDTLESAGSAIGVEVTQVEISAYDFGSGYGDFKLFHYKVKNRGVADGGLADDLDNLVAGMFIDWDIQDSYGRNAVEVVPEIGAYAIWDSGSGNFGVGFGHLVLPARPSLLANDQVDGVTYHHVWAIANGDNVYPGSVPGYLADEDDLNAIDGMNNYFLGAGYDPDATGAGDKSGFFGWSQFDLDDAETQHLYCAEIGVNTTSNDRAVIEADMKAMAFRANKWAGFNRGDVNDDNKLDAIDMSYLSAANNGAPLPIFPYDGDQDAFNGGNGDCDLDGDRDADDVTAIFNYLMGGAAPIGAWRFGYMP